MCNVDCELYPDACINEQLYETQAALLISEGYLEAGYTQVNIDDCWSTMERDPVTDEQVADPARFPSGIKALAGFMHDRDLKLGLYSDIGTKTCGGYIGMQDHLKLDANTFASWDIDMLKVDGCNQDPAIMNSTYTELSSALNATGRDIVYSCSWPAYLQDDWGEANGGEVLYRLQEICHLWRNYDDIADSWSSVSDIINMWKRTDPEDPFVKVAQPGAWNDPDMLMIGNNGLSHTEERTQMALWSIFAAPLLMSNDLASVSEESKAILLNKEIIAVDQDVLGKQGYMVGGDGDYRVWAREMSDGSFAVVLQNACVMNRYEKITFTPDMIGWGVEQVMQVRDLYEMKDLGEMTEISMNVQPSDVEMFRVYKE